MAPMIAAPIFIMRLSMKPRNTPTSAEKIKDAKVLKNESSYPLDVKDVNILSIKNRSIVMPNPAIVPVVKIVISKNLRPWNPTMIPKAIARMPNI